MADEDRAMRLWGDPAAALDDAAVAGADAAARPQPPAPRLDSQGRPVTECCGALVLGRTYECVCAYERDHGGEG